MILYKYYSEKVLCCGHILVWTVFNWKIVRFFCFLFWFAEIYWLWFVSLSKWYFTENLLQNSCKSCMHNLATKGIPYKSVFKDLFKISQNQTNQIERNRKSYGILTYGSSVLRSVLQRPRRRQRCRVHFQLLQFLIWHICLYHKVGEHRCNLFRASPLYLKCKRQMMMVYYDWSNRNLDLESNAFQM